jgi:hypothetical protein
MRFWIRFVIQVLGGLMTALAWTCLGARIGLFDPGRGSAFYGWGLFLFFLMGAWWAKKAVEWIAARKSDRTGRRPS